MVEKVRSIGKVFRYFFKEGSWFEDLDRQRNIHDGFACEEVDSDFLGEVDNDLSLVVYELLVGVGKGSGVMAEKIMGFKDSVLLTFL